MKLRPIKQNQTASLHWLIEAFCKISTMSPRAGFTLIELLVGLVIGSILTTLVLFSAVQLMGTNQREAVRSDTQREMQAAIDYINRDLREAIYVYDGQCLRPDPPAPPPAGDPPPEDLICPDRRIVDSLPTGLNTATNTPVLAFWRLDPLPQPLIDRCRAEYFNVPRPADLATVPCTRRSMYTLVVYSLNTSGSSTWAGRARIRRYTLPQFSFSGGTTVTQGWRDPVITGFTNWPRDPQNNGLPARPDNMQGNNLVLTDFIDDRDDYAKGGGDKTVCPSVNDIAPENPGGFYASPAKPQGGFYACVRGSDVATLNQEVIVRLRANVAGQPGVPRNSAGTPITMETRVLTRGVLERR